MGLFGFGKKKKSPKDFWVDTPGSVWWFEFNNKTRLDELSKIKYDSIDNFSIILNIDYLNKKWYDLSGNSGKLMYDGRIKGFTHFMLDPLSVLEFFSAKILPKIPKKLSTLSQSFEEGPELPDSWEKIDQNYNSSTGMDTTKVKLKTKIEFYIGFDGNRWKPVKVSDVNEEILNIQNKLIGSKKSLFEKILKFYDKKGLKDQISFERISNQKKIRVLGSYSKNELMDITNNKKKILTDREKIRRKNLKKNLSEELKVLDKDNNGVVDIIEDDCFGELLKKHQSRIIEIDRKYIKDFVKISNLIKCKKQSIQISFESLKKVKNISDLKSYVKIISNQKHVYELILLHSISMITSLVNDDLITFYEIYEEFDKVEVFQSNHETLVLNELKSINEQSSTMIKKFDDLMYRVNEFENSMVDSLSHLSYTTSQGFSNLSSSIGSELRSINSSIGFNNLLTGIQTYQMYKINKNTKSLRS